MQPQNPPTKHSGPTGYDGPICAVCDAPAQYGGAAYGGYFCDEHLPLIAEDERQRFLDLEAEAIRRWNEFAAKRRAEGLAVRVSLHAA